MPSVSIDNRRFAVATTALLRVTAGSSVEQLQCWESINRHANAERHELEQHSGTGELLSR
jgi:hypothetical protein